MRMRNGWAKKATAAAVTVAAIPALTIAGTGAANAWGPGSAKNPRRASSRPSSTAPACRT
ncbi:hypothetical protein MTP03_01810 [Tsukamurella sp. PLM1]|nr:hypothetical protein MTP03_01810 [Tsukamurella sp. PLM1]